MYCNQCEQTAKGIACTVAGVCGKNTEVASMQDLLLHALKDLAAYAHQARKAGYIDSEINRFTALALFSTLTNVDFDCERLKELIEETQIFKARIVGSVDKQVISSINSNFIPAQGLDEMIQQGKRLGLLSSVILDEDIKSLQELLLYSLKGIAAYTHHAAILGQEDDRIYAFMHEALARLGNKELELNDWLNLVIKSGEINYIAMEILDRANTSVLGNPVPTSVPLGHKKGKCILVSGHDLKDLQELLKQTENTGINIYTHGEMLPAHGYPELKKYKHLYGNFGTAWQNQRKEFPAFPGPILMTTNCIQQPQESYLNTIFTCGPVAWPGVKHIADGNYQELIETALAMPGFDRDEEKGSVMVGFAHNAVMQVADQVIAGVKSGAIKHFFLVGGCDGAKSGRNYYTEFVDKTPADTVILTLGCGKYRFYDHKLGMIGNIPRLLDAGQCNDAYSAIQIALALSNALECSVNELPLSLIISWYEQKAVAILCTLLYLGIKDIRLGPSLPAFISPNILKVLVEKFAIKPITTADEDLKAILV